MNFLLIIQLLGKILLIEAAAMLPSLGVALWYGDANDALPLALSIGITAAAGGVSALLSRPKDKNLRLKEGFLAVALGWVLLAAFGALPFVFSGVLPNYFDAFFETASGFTTTGATVISSFEEYPRGVFFWRSFTHWIGGMGVLVLTLAILPSGVGRAAHLMRAESPGPEFSKILPKTGSSAKALYLIYAGLTALMFAVLLCVGLSPYDAAIHTFGTAGTGGFSNYALSVGGMRNPVADWTITFFMCVFSLNFALYYRAITGHWRDLFRSEEFRWFAGIYLACSLGSALMALPMYDTVEEGFRHGFFTIASMMSTSGYATTDFNLWPQSAKMLILFVMFVGGCAGSTAGGLKVVRVGLLTKMGLKEIRSTFQPRKVQIVRFEGRAVDRDMPRQMAVFFFSYMLLLFLAILCLSLENLYDFETNFTAALTCISNVGPGFGAVGPMGNFAGFSNANKFMLSMLMLAGRLEIFPILMLFHPAAWRKTN